jgi:adenosylmethionine-8-amino-7-oxononanoate aminotransferase
MSSGPEEPKKQQLMEEELREQLYSWDRSHLIHPVTSWDEQEQTDPRLIVDAQGCRLWDAEGNEYIDAISGLWLANVGYGRKELARVAQKQLKQLAYYPLFFGWSHEPAIRLAKTLSDLAPENLRHVLFASGGSEANETSIKYARMYHSLRGNDGKYKVIARHRAYHGVSYGAVSATGLEGMHENIGPLNPGFVHVPPPYCYHCPWGKAYPGCDLECADAVEEAIVEEGPSTVAAFIAEPVIGVGGVIVPPDEYYPRIRESCNRHDVLLIADEVITGFGRIGHWFGINRWQVEPDLISTAKGITSGYLPLGASVIHDRIYDVIASSGASVGHGYTYSGHPAAAAVALANIQLIEEEGLLDRSRRMGKKLTELLRAQDNPYIGEVRGAGLMLGVELVKDRAAREVFDEDKQVNSRVESAALARGIIVRALGTTVIALSPPLIISEEECEELVDKLDTTIREVCSEL